MLLSNSAKVIAHVRMKTNTANILIFNLTQKQLTHTVQIVFIYFTLPVLKVKVMKLLFSFIYLFITSSVFTESEYKYVAHVQSQVL